MIFDSHAHLVAADMQRYPPTPLKGTLDRALEPFTAEELIKQMDQNGVQRAVAVQRAHVYGFNNDYVADAAARHPDRLVAIGMIDTLDSKAPELVRYWVQERGLVGIRMTEAVRDSGTAWVCGPIAQEVWKLASELGISVCLHFMRWNREHCLSALKEMCQRFSDTTVVVDHFSNLIGEQGAPHHGVDSPLLELAAFPKVLHKFTTINIAKLGTASLPFAPVVQHMVRTFGAERVMWGSDVAQSKGSYAEMVQAASAAVSLLTEAQSRQVMHDTASTVYGKPGT